MKRLLDSLLGRFRTRVARATPRRPRAQLAVEPLESRTVLSTNNPGFVQKAFMDLLGRPVDPVALTTFTALLDTAGVGRPPNEIALARDATRFALIQGILGSPEFRQVQVRNSFQTFLNRPPEPAALTAFASFLVGGATVEQVQGILTSSDEYFLAQGGGTNAGFLNALFMDALGRPIDAPTAAQLGGLLNAGQLSRGAVSAIVLTSTEFRQRLVNGFFMQFLGRPADRGGSDTYTTALNLGARQELVISFIVGSREYEPPLPGKPPDFGEILLPDEVSRILGRAAAASASDDAIIAVMDRGGRVLGVKVESGALANLGVTPTFGPGGQVTLTGNLALLSFAVDGALAKARTAAFFANNEAPLTSRTVQFISQSTLTSREIDANPNVLDPLLRGPGFVAAVGSNGHFPPDVPFTPQVDLFQIEHTNRDSLLHPVDGIKGNGNDVFLLNNGRGRFNIPLTEPGGQLTPPEAYGFISGLFPNDQARGIGTLPGGVPIFKNGKLVGGIGVFFPGRTGFATEEHSRTDVRFQGDRTSVDRSEEAEFVAAAAIGGSSGAGLTVGRLGGIDLPQNPDGSLKFDIPFGRLDLVGITLDVIGPLGNEGPRQLFLFAQSLGIGQGNANSGVNLPVRDILNQPPIDTNPADGLTFIDGGAATPGQQTFLQGQVVPEGFLVAPKAGVLANGQQVTAADVARIIGAGIAQANQTKAAIRLPQSKPTKMVLAVTDLNGEVLGLYRMPDATIFSIDVAVAKARNVAYYSDPAAVQVIDLSDRGTGLQMFPAGTALTNRTYRYLGQPRFPEAIDGAPPGPFSQLLDDPVGIDRFTGVQVGPRQPFTAFAQSVVGNDSFFPGTNFHEPNLNADGSPNVNRNGIVFFPGSTPIYRTVNGVQVIIGGFGVSGDGVDQDDVVTFAGSQGFQPAGPLRVDSFTVRNVRPPFIKFLRNPEGI